MKRTCKYNFAKAQNPRGGDIQKSASWNGSCETAPQRKKHQIKIMLNKN